MPWIRTFVWGVTRMAMLFAHRFDHFLSRIGHGIGADDGEAGLLQNLFAQRDVVSFQAHNQWQMKMRFLYRGHDARRNDVALHDAAENIYEDPFYVRVFENDFERGRDLLRAGATAHVKEVGRAAAVM